MHQFEPLDNKEVGVEEKLKCIVLPELILVSLSVGLFLLAYCVYLCLLFVSRKIFQYNRLGKNLVEGIKYPILGLLLECTALIVLTMFALSSELAAVLRHAIIVILIATLGWLALQISHALYKSYADKFLEGKDKVYTDRSTFTQILFVYRFFSFIIVAVTIAAILITFPYIKSLGVGILGSAGIAGIALGIAARPILLNMIAGLQIACTKTIKINDIVFVQGNMVRIESIHLTHVIAISQDLRRFILPISLFVDQPFENWDLHNPELMGTVSLFCDYTAPIGAIRTKANELIQNQPWWNKRVCKVLVANCKELVMEVSVIFSVYDSTLVKEANAYMREHLIEFLQKNYGYSLPCTRVKQIYTAQPGEGPGDEQS